MSWGIKVGDPMGFHGGNHADRCNSGTAILGHLPDKITS